VNVATTPTPSPSPSAGMSDSDFQAKILNLIQAAATGGGSADQPGASTQSSSNLMQAPIYWPGRPPVQVALYAGTTTPDNRGAVPEMSSPETSTVGEAYQDFYGWSDAERQKLGKALVDAGLIDQSKAGDFHTLESAWQYLVNESAYFYDGGRGRKVDPWNVISIMADPSKAPGAAGEATTRTTHSTSVDLTDPETAKATVNNVLAQAIGRAATPEEYQALLSTLNRAEAASPTNTDTTTTYDSTGAATSQSSTTSGGLGAAGSQQVILDQAMKMPDYGAYQASTSYLNALFGAIRSPVA
jgi:hypothetical protein